MEVSRVRKQNDRARTRPLTFTSKAQLPNHYSSAPILLGRKLSSPFKSFAALIIRYVSQEFTAKYEPTIGRIHNYNVFITFVFMSCLKPVMICKN